MAFEDERVGIEWIDGSQVGFEIECEIAELLQNIDWLVNPRGLDLAFSDRGSPEGLDEYRQMFAGRPDLEAVNRIRITVITDGFERNSISEDVHVLRTLR